MNKQIKLVIHGRGGAGRSFFATNFVQYLKDCGIEHHAIGLNCGATIRAGNDPAERCNFVIDCRAALNAHNAPEVVVE